MLVDMYLFRFSEEVCMRHKKISFMMISVGILLIIATGAWLATATPVKAQCGSQASSCKNCHEVQGQKPVNNDGSTWHTSHAFGDFCYICHGGNNQATDEATAHVGLEDPLADIQASCQQCHPNDLQARAQVYATALGVEIGAGSATSAQSNSTPTDDSTQPTPVAAAPISAQINYDDPNLVNYVTRYDEIVLHKEPVNWGNVILLGLIGLVAVGGGGFVITREKLVKVSFGETEKVGDEYPTEVVELLPAIVKLPPADRKILKNILVNPRKTEKVLRLIDAVISEEKKD
jgi:hypothetical protein